MPWPNPRTGPIGDGSHPSERRERAVDADRVYEAEVERRREVSPDA